MVTHGALEIGLGGCRGLRSSRTRRGIGINIFKSMFISKTFIEAVPSALSLLVELKASPIACNIVFVLNLFSPSGLDDAPLLTRDALSRLSGRSVVWRARGDMHSDPPKPRREMDLQNKLGFDRQRCGFRMKKPRFVAGL